MKIFSYILVTMAFLAGCKSDSNSSKSATAALDPNAFRWVDINEAASMANSENKMYFIDVYTDWCGWCKVMDRETFSKPEVQQALKARFHTLKFNAEQKQSITFAGNTYPWQEGGRNGINMLAVALLQGELSYPSYVILDKDKKLIKVTRGFIQADEFLKELSSIQ
jgi:thioredoxin-related protein